LRFLRAGIRRQQQRQTQARNLCRTKTHESSLRCSNPASSSGLFVLPVIPRLVASPSGIASIVSSQLKLFRRA
jgi:hypothetical protein